MSITLNSEQERFIQEKLRTGKYRSSDEVLAEAFRLLEERDKHYEQWLNETREKIAVGLTQLEQGEGLDSEVSHFTTSREVSTGTRKRHMNRYTISPAASQDLDEITDYFLSRSVEAGEKFIQEFDKKCQNLVQFPNIGRCPFSNSILENLGINMVDRKAHFLRTARTWQTASS